MDIIEPRQKKEFENVLPLINIIFLLLIFFMLAGVLVQPDAISVSTPYAKIDNQASQDKLTILMDRENLLAIKGTLYSKEEIVEFIKEQQLENEQLTVQLKADSQVISKDLLEIMDLFSKAGLSSIHLLTTNSPSSL